MRWRPHRADTSTMDTDRGDLYADDHALAIADTSVGLPPVRTTDLVLALSLELLERVGLAPSDRRSGDLPVLARVLGLEPARVERRLDRLGR